jgi:acetyl-CoA acetyltransferase
MSKVGEQIAIVGVYQTRQARRINRPTIELLLEALRGALDDARLTKNDIDGVSGSWPGPGGSDQAPQASDWAKQLGVELAWVNDTHPAGPPALELACAAISAGLCNTVAIVDGQSRLGVPPPLGQDVVPRENEFVEIWGAATPSVHYALAAQRHMHRFGTTSEQLAQVSATIRNHGRLNPDAVYSGRGPFTVNDILASRVVAWPLHLLDVSMVSEGAAAVIVTNRVAESPHPIFVRGMGTSFVGNYYLDAPVYEEIASVGATAAERALGRAGLDRSDMHVFQMFDGNAFEVIRQFEAFGYCAIGDGGAFASDGRLNLDGSHPTCTDGGLLSHAHISSGARNLKLKEAVDQLRGHAGSRQVAGARNAFVASGGGAAKYMSVSILSADHA